jgi:hypothetical protein
MKNLNCCSVLLPQRAILCTQHPMKFYLAPPAVPLGHGLCYRYRQR